MSLLSSPQFLRAVVWFDALTGILPGSLHLLMTSALSEGLGLAPGLLQVSGVLLLGYAALAASIARAQPLPLGRLRVLLVGNGAWALASLALWVGAAFLIGWAVIPILILVVIGMVIWGIILTKTE